MGSELTGRFFAHWQPKPEDMWTRYHPMCRALMVPETDLDIIVTNMTIEQFMNDSEQQEKMLAHWEELVDIRITDEEIRREIKTIMTMIRVAEELTIKRTILKNIHQYGKKGKGKWTFSISQDNIDKRLKNYEK